MSYPPHIEMKEMTPAEAARFIRKIAQTTRQASQDWDNFEQIVLGMINSAMDAAREFGRREAQAPAISATAGEEPQS